MANDNIQYQELTSFRNSRDQLLNILKQIRILISELVKCNSISGVSLDELLVISQNLENLKFYISVTGESNAGKSTLINALLGKSIQPTDILPCSGTVSKIQYAETERITCYYENGKTEILHSYDEYKSKTSIKFDEASQKSPTIREVIFETPNLEVCRQGGVIIDSPGLNEHPERTKITQQILENVDAVIFVSGASRVLSQLELQTLANLRKHLNIGDESRPARSLFVVFNAIDFLETEEKRERFRGRAQELLMKSHGNASPLLDDQNRIHYISAEKSLEATQKNISNKYSDDFHAFVKALEAFLANDRGLIQMTSAQARSQQFCGLALEKIEFARGDMQERVSYIFQTLQTRAAILEEVGEMSGRVIVFNEYATQQRDAFIQNYRQLFQEWKKDLKKRLKVASTTWKDKHQGLDKIKSYAKQLESSFIKDLKKWLETTLILEHLEPTLINLNEEAQKMIQQIDERLLQLGGQVQAFNFNPNFDFRNSNWSKIDDEMGAWGFGGSAAITLGVILTGALGAAILIPSITIAPIIAAAAVLLGGGGLVSVGSGILGQLDKGTRDEVFKEGFKSIEKNVPNIAKNLEDALREQFDKQISSVNENVQNRISALNSVLENNQEISSKTLEEWQANLAWLEDRRAKFLELQEKLNGFSYQADS